MNRGNLRLPTVLVVDDEALIRWSLSQALMEEGYAVRTASTGAEARGLLASADHEPLLVLLDLRLPDVSDWSLLQDLRAARPDAPVIVITAHGGAEDAIQALGLGAARFVGKPFDVGELMQVVGDVWTERPVA